MDVVKVRVEELMETVKKNRDSHRDVFRRAQEGYRVKVIELLDQMLENARRGGQISLAFDLPVPTDHTVDYDRVIKMLEMTVDEEVELDQGDFAQYVMDDWSWKRQFVANTVTYLAQ